MGGYCGAVVADCRILWTLGCGVPGVRALVMTAATKFHQQQERFGSEEVYSQQEATPSFDDKR